jgi:uroporphyrinogen-III decarboxylase
LGHGITPDVDPERVAVLVDTVQSYVLGAAAP